MSFAGWDPRGSFEQNERAWASLGLIAVVGFALFDFFEDLAAGQSTPVLLSDVSDSILPILLLAYIWRHLPLTLRRSNTQLNERDTKREADLTHWREIATGYLEGLGEVINIQCDRWGLTGAEKEVACLLLKGLSLQEIAQARGVAERTVRQQAIAVYSKSGLAGRAELSAFFLEDLLLPDGFGAELHPKTSA